MKGRKKRNVRGWGGTGRFDVLQGFGFTSYIFKTLAHTKDRSPVFPLIICIYTVVKRLEELNLGFLFSIPSVFLTNPQMI